MASKRKRKMTLFDVMNSGAPVGIQVKDRSAASRGDPTRGIGRLSSASTRSSGRAAPTSAADELAALRRELGARPAAAVLDPHVVERQANAIPLEPAPEQPVVKVRPPRAPRKPIGQSVREAWTVVSPHVSKAAGATGRGLRAVGRGTASAADASWRQASRVNDLDTRYLITGGVAIAAIALLSGAFYVGRLLAHRPTNTVIALDGTRPDVLNVGPTNRAGEANIGNIVERQPQTRLEKNERQQEPVAPPQPKQPEGPAFGGRDLSLNYLVIDRYDNPADAAAASDALAKARIKTTVEKNLPHWGKDTGKDHYYVVDTEGFAKVSTPQFQARVEAITRVGDKLNPAPYKYQRSAN